MDVQVLTGVFIDNIVGFTIGTGVLFLVFALLVFRLYRKVARMQSLYEKMMEGRTGVSLEDSVLSFIAKTEVVGAENLALREKVAELERVLQMAVTKKAMIRFRAFEDMGSDQSYAAAFLDAQNNGIVFSSIFAREVSRTYAKPIQGGRSEYALSTEEEQVLSEAMQQR